MEREKLDQFLKQWEATFERPATRQTLKELARIALLILLLLLIAYSADRLKKEAQAHHQTQSSHEQDQ